MKQARGPRLREFVAEAIRQGADLPKNPRNLAWVDLARRTGGGWVETDDEARRHLIAAYPRVRDYRLQLEGPSRSKGRKKAKQKPLGRSLPASVKCYTQTPPPNFRPPKVDPNGPEFLLSFEWRTLRMKVLAHYGRVCMCCGASPDNSGEVMNVDHIKPRRKRPDLALDFDNLQVLCGTCNHGKSNWDETDWRPVDGRQKEFDDGARAHLRLIGKAG